MITIQYPAANKTNVVNWQARLDTMFAKYSFIEDNNLTEALLTEGRNQAKGINAIDAYLDDLERLVAGRYEDRCDRYDFDPDEAR